MMPIQLPPVDEDVFEALQLRAEPLVDDVNSVLRRLLGLDSTETEEGSAQTASQSSARAPMAETGSATPQLSARGRAGRAKGTKATSRPRAARGSLLPEHEYEEPLLEALVARGGSAPASEVIEAVGAALDERLTNTDRELLDSGMVRWRNRAQFVRLKLVQAGHVKKDSPRGVWEITPSGRERVESSASGE